MSDGCTSRRSPTAQGRERSTWRRTVWSDLVDSQGRTLYLFAKDTGTQSECTGRQLLASAPGDRHANGRWRGRGLARGNHHALGR
jgi:predicted lipoprotein with Yx(FWY)xxD motif